MSAIHPNLIAWYRGEGTANDASGVGHNGTWHGSAAYVAGKIGQAFSLDGLTDYVDVGEGGGDFDFGAGDFSMALWFNKTNDTSYGSFLDKYVPNSNDRSWGFRTDNANSQLVFVTEADGAAGNTKLLTTDSSVWTAGTWTHVVFTKSGTVGNFYVDGVLVGDDGTALDATIYDSAAKVTIGAGVESTTNFFGGSIDEVMIFDCALDANDRKRAMLGMLPARIYT